MPKNPMGGMSGLMKQAQQMQNKILKLQEEMAEKEVEGSAGGGMVTVTANGKNEVKAISIEKEVVDPEDIEMLQDLILAAVNDALTRSQEMMASEMQKITGGMNVPGLM
jgi:DNA-binding YbaB/EbfC family protein